MAGLWKCHLDTLGDCLAMIPNILPSCHAEQSRTRQDSCLETMTHPDFPYVLYSQQSLYIFTETKTTTVQTPKQHPAPTPPGSPLAFPQKLQHQLQLMLAYYSSHLGVMTGCPSAAHVTYKALPLKHSTY